MPDEVPIDANGRSPGESLRDLLYERARASKKISWLLDECIRVPGTDLRFGLDPLIGMVPYGGETVATLFGTTILAQAGRKGVPFATLLKMGGNMILNAAIGVVPVVGDLFSFWFKSNSRNYRLLDSYLGSEDGREAEGGWWPLLLVLGVILVVVALNVLAWVILTALIVGLGQEIGRNL